MASTPVLWWATSSDSMRNVIDNSSLEGLQHRLVIPSDEQLLEKSSIPRYEKSTCSRFICN